MTRPALLVVSPMRPGLVSELARRCDVVGPLPGAPAEAARALPPDVAARVRVAMALGIEPIGASFAEALPQLGLVQCLGTGYDAIDVAALAQRGVAVSHSPGANASAVADIALALTIECIRDIPRKRRFLHAGQWNGLAGQRPDPCLGLAGRRMGIYGLGEIGRRIAVRAQACEMEIGYHGRRAQHDVAYPYFPSLLALAQWADVLMIAARADAANRNAVDRDVLAAIGSHGFVVNVGRGSLVDEPALIDALRDRTIAGAGLDVFAHEPDVPQALRDLPNVALTPHLGGVCGDARSRMEAMVLANLDAFLAGQPLPNAVRPA